MKKNKLHFRLAAGRRKTGVLFLLLAGSLALLPVPAASQVGESVAGARPYELGDQMVGIDFGVLIPLFFQDLSGNLFNTNLSLGGAAILQWQTYLYPFLRVGAGIGGSFNISPQLHSLLMLPILLQATYVITLSRFEFPVFLGLGLNVVRYTDLLQVDIALHPGIGGFWRYDVNWSFGLQASWWWELQLPTQFQSANQARIGHFLQLTPAILYHF
jgi:hypothetical protein